LEKKTEGMGEGFNEDSRRREEPFLPDHSGEMNERGEHWFLFLEKEGGRVLSFLFGTNRRGGRRSKRI